MDTAMTTALERWTWLVAELNGRVVFGMPRVRDPDHPCDQFEPGDPSVTNSCQGDGHYMCLECGLMLVCFCGNRHENCTCPIDDSQPPRHGWRRVTLVD